MQFRVNFTDNVTLTYSLVDAPIVDGWVEILKTRSINDLCPNNHYIGYVSDEMLYSRINRLYELADYINEHTPERVIKVEITKDNYQDALNTMHVHFPLLKNDDSYQHIWHLLSEYNDNIHWIESTIKNRWNNPSSSRLFRITFDFNKSGTEFRLIPDEAYPLFDPHTLFGELKLHYTHVGRHAQELYLANDTVCPKDQFVPQRLYTASVRMYFTDDFRVDMDKWKVFYETRGRDFWDFAIDDPKLAFGYIKIGQLTNICLDGVDVEIPTDSESRHLFRSRLSNTKVISGEII